MTAEIYLKPADESDDIRSGEITDYDSLVKELEDSYELGPALSRADMGPLVKDRIRTLIDESDTSDDKVESLLESFINALHDWQRTSEKVVLVLKTEDYIILSHGHHEDGSYFNDGDYEVGERILDTDNIISSAKITKSNQGTYNIEYHTRSDSDYFRRYIGLSDISTDEQRVYITFDYNGNGINTSFSVAESRFVDTDNISFDVEECNLDIYGDTHPLEKISWNGTSYDGSATYRLMQFQTDLEKKRRKLHVHDDKIRNINGLVDQADSEADVVEEASRVLIDGSSYSKITGNSDVLPIYATAKYDYIDEEFIDTIINRVINKSTLELYGPADGYSKNPLRISSGNDTAKLIFNSIDEEQIDESRKEIINSLYRDAAENIRDEAMAKMLTRVLFEVVNISLDERTEHLQKICDSFSMPEEQTTEHENDTIEYKRELPGQGAEEIVEQMRDESNPGGLKILIWGISEDDKYQISPLESTPDSDTCRNIEKRCLAETSLSEVKVHEMDINTEQLSGKIMFGLMLGDTSQSEALAHVFG